MRPVTAVPALLLALAVFAAPARAGEMRHPEDAALHAVQFVDASEGWAVGDEGVIWHTIDAGKEWELVPSHVRASLRSVCFLNPYLGWIVGRDELPDGQSAGVLLFTADGGVTWKRVLLNALPGLNVVRFADEKTGYLAGDGSDQHPSGLFVTTDSGRTWEPVPGPRVASWLAGDFGGGNGGAPGRRLGPPRHRPQRQGLHGRHGLARRPQPVRHSAARQNRRGRRPGRLAADHRRRRVELELRRSGFAEERPLRLGLSRGPRRRQAILGGRPARFGGAAQRRRRRPLGSAAHRATAAAGRRVLRRRVARLGGRRIGIDFGHDRRRQELEAPAPRRPAGGGAVRPRPRRRRAAGHRRPARRPGRLRHRRPCA